jgi:hypothetical protein
MKPEIEKILSEEPTVSVPVAGDILGDLGRNGSYAAARRGQIPTLRFGNKLRVSTAVVRKMLLEGVQPATEKQPPTKSGPTK